MQLPYSKACLVHALFSKISKVESFLLHFLCTPVDIFCFVIGFGCYHSQMHFQLQQHFSVSSNIISVILSVSVSTQPRSAPLRLFFFCWVWDSVAISTVFHSYFTTFLIELGYLENIKTVEQMLNNENEFGFVEWNVNFFPILPNLLTQQF